MGDRELAEKYVHKSIRLFEKGQGGRSGSIAHSLRAILDAEAGAYARALSAMQASENLCIPIKKRSWMAVHYTACYCVKKELEHMVSQGASPSLTPTRKRMRRCPLFSPTPAKPMLKKRWSLPGNCTSHPSSSFSPTF